MFAQFNAISANVLHRRGAHATWNEGEIFQAAEPLSERPKNEVVPGFARRSLDQDGGVIEPHARNRGVSHLATSE